MKASRDAARIFAEIGERREIKTNGKGLKAAGKGFLKVRNS